MAPYRFCLVSGWEVLVEEWHPGEWHAFIRFGAPVQPAYLTWGTRVPGGPFPTRRAAGHAGVGYAEEQKRWLPR
jgi:hypothetical protein